MKTGLQRGRRAAFTLIELLAVMGVIVVLAGLILAIAGSAQTQGARRRATAELKAFETAIEAYKSDNGAYPRSDATDKKELNPTLLTDGNSASGDPMKGELYKKSAEFLYQELTGNRPKSGNSDPSQTASATPVPRNYLPNLTPAGIEPAPDAPLTNGVKVKSLNSPYMFLADPWGFPYGYSTATAANQEKPSEFSDPGNNPTYDLWSTAGYSASAGKKLPSPLPTTGTRANAIATFWIKNW